MMQAAGNGGSTTNSRDSQLSDHDAVHVKSFIVNSRFKRKFIVNSGASVHATGDLTLFSYLEDTTTNTRLCTANGMLDITGRGTVQHHNITLYGSVDPVLELPLFPSCDPARTRSVFRKDECHFRCQKSLLPEGELGMDKKSLSSPITIQALEVDTKWDALRDGGDSIVQESGDFFGVSTDADNQHGNERNIERNQMFKQSKTCSCGSGSKSDDDIDNIQQQQHRQQHVAAMNWINIPGSMNCNHNSGCTTHFWMALNEQRSLEDTYQKPQHTDGAPVINFTEQKGEPELHRCFSLSLLVMSGGFHQRAEVLKLIFCRLWQKRNLSNTLSTANNIC